MANINGMFMTNLAYNITEESLLKGIIEIWPEELQHVHKEGNLRIKLYGRQGSKMNAVVSGFSTKLETLRNKAIGKKLFKRDIVIKADYGEARKEDGSFLVGKPAYLRRDQLSLEGSSVRRIWQLFKPEFIESINTKILKDGAFTMNTSKIPEDELEALAPLRFAKIDKRKDRALIRYESILGTMQAISHLCNNTKYTGQPIRIGNVEGEMSSSIRCKGLGKREISGSTPDLILDLDFILKNHNGVTPFNLLADDVVDRNVIARGLSSRCWRCNQSYRLQGISMNLNYVTGVCNCTYIGEGQGFHWKGEKETRLMLGEKTSVDRNIYKNLHILHEPMTTYYKDSVDYARIVLPIIEDEWRMTSQTFKEEYQCDAQIEFVEFIEQTQMKTKRRKLMRDIYALELTVNKSRHWTAAKLKHSIKKVTIIMKIEKKDETRSWYYSQKEVKGRVLLVKEGPDSHLLLLQLQVYCEPGDCPVLDNQFVHLEAKPDKAKYTKTRHIINQWTRDVMQSQPFLQFILGHEQNWTIPDQEDTLRQNGVIDIIQSLAALLNKRQHESLTKALNSSVSCIQGPPGTGKTFNIATISIILALKEPGLIIVCTPSNESADGCAEKIATLTNQFNLDIPVVRIMSKSKESVINPKHKNVKFLLLHELVRQSREWTGNEDVMAIVRKSEKEGPHKLKKAEIEEVEEHVRKVERIVLDGTRILVMTITTMADQRVEALAESLPIGSLILDEAGQVTQPTSLIFSIVKPKRVILTGDHRQLQPQINSYASKTAGLNKSPLEWGASSSITAWNPNPPFTMLTVQFRMATNIRKIVSAIFYNDGLEDAECIKTRQPQIGVDILKSFPTVASTPVLIKDMDSEEEKMGTSYRNVKEGDAIIEIVGDLMIKSNIKPNQITILTLYDAQRQFITDKLFMKDKETDRQMSEVLVTNVDSFQGRENSIIILSLVRSTNNIGFSKCPNRLNVAISRAKEVLFVVGNMTAFRSYNSEVWNKFCAQIEIHGQNI